MKKLLAIVGLLVLLGGAAAWAEDGVTDKEVVIGAGLDLTGAVANWGVNIKAGMDAVFSRVNAAGGVHGRKIRLIAYDHVYQPPKAVTNAKRLVERDKIFVMMGHLGTPTTKAVMDYRRADIDFSSQAAKLKESGADAVIVRAVYREPPRLAEQCHAIGYNPVFIGPSPIVVAKTIELGGKHVEGLMGVEVYPLPTDPGPFLDQYRADMAKYAPSLPIDTTNLYGYQKAALFAEALQRTGRSLTRDSVLRAIESIKDWDPGWGLKYTYGGDNRRGMSNAGRLVVVKDGKWTKASEWTELKEVGRR